LRQAGYFVGPGDLGENVTTAGLNLDSCHSERRSI
jgi:MOSC domain-containing protein YiiM